MLKQVAMCLLSAQDPDSSLWLWLGAAAVLAAAGFYCWHRRRRAGPAKPPASDPPPPRGGFEVQAEPSLRAGRAAQPSLRLRFRGQVKLDRSLDLVLVVGIRDVTGGIPRPVFGTSAGQRDPDTGEFRMKHQLGLLAPPGRDYAGWTPLGVVDLASLQAPFAGHRQLQIFCAGISEPLADVLDPTQNLYHECWANATVEVYLPTPGYTQLRQARCVGAGLVVGASLAVARAEGWGTDDAVARIRSWMVWHARAQEAHFPEEADELRRSMDGALELALRLTSPGGTMIAQLVALGQPELQQAMFRLCLAMGRRHGGMSPVRMVELARQLEIPPEAWVRLHEQSQEPEDLEALALEFGLEPGWAPAQVKAHLRKEFAACNARSLLAGTGAERAELQARMAVIAKLTRRFG